MDKALSLRATGLGRLSLLGKTWRNGRLETEYTRFSVRASSLVHPRTSISIWLWAQGFRDVWVNTVLPIPHYQSYEETVTIPCAAVTAWNAFLEKKSVTKIQLSLLWAMAVWDQEPLIQSIKSIKREGYVHLAGFVGQNKPAETINDLANMMLFDQITISGITVGSKGIAERLDAFMTKHKIKPVIDRVFGWKEVIEALDYQSTRSRFGKGGR
ncbi:Zinc-binding dehydrogenase [Ceratobasidium sp. AG-Ba]|nr:Zinc-binding dehydrogenase [Ceratobasidium sp. AG-Ba]